MTRSSRWIRFGFAVLLAVCVLGAGSAQASGWSRWLGPNHDGTAPAEGLFAAEGFGLEVAWNRTLGIAYSGIAVQDGVAVTMFADGEIDWLIAVEAATGKELWRYEIGAMYAAHGGSEGGPVGMPVIDDGVVYGLGAMGHLFAVNFKDGKEIWSLRIDEEFGARAPSYGFTSTPLLIDDLLFLQAGGDEGRSLIGFDKSNGKLRWSVGDDKVSYQSPILFEQIKTRQIIAVTNSRVLGLAPDDGKVLWSHDLDVAEGNEDGYATAVLLGGGAFLLTGQPESKAYRLVYVEYEAKKKKDSSVGFRVEEHWTSTQLKGSLATPVLHDGHLYGFDAEFLTCLDASTGERVWKSRPPGGRGLVLIDGHLVIFANDGSVVAAEATPEGYVEQARVKVSEAGSYSYPSYDDGRFFVRNTTDFAAVSVGAASSAGSATDARGEPRNEFERFVQEVEQADEKSLLVADFMNAQVGFPVVEGDRWVHFIYRGEIDDIAISGTMIEFRTEEVLERIEGTDIYYISYPIEPGARLEYRFNVDFENPQTDPLNPRRVAADDGELSEVITSGWRSPGYLRAYQGDQPGTLDSFTFASEILENERSVDVYLPWGYDDGDQRYPLLVLEEGADWLDKGQLANTLNQMTGRTIRPLIVAFLRQPEETQRAELGGDKTAEHVRMVTEELVPQLDRKYRTRTEPGARTIAGIGSGALTATYAAVERPDLFGNAAGLSYYLASPEAAGMMDAIAAADAGAKARFWIKWNLYELRRAEWNVDLAADSRRTAAALEASGFEVEATEVVDSTGWGGWRIRAGELLMRFYPLKK